MATLRDLWRAPPRGVALVEFGLAAPILILLIVGLIDLGLAFYNALQVQGAAAAGAQYASVHGFNPADLSGIKNAVCGSTGTTKCAIAPVPAPSQVCACPTMTGLKNIVAVPAIGDCSTTSCTGVTGYTCGSSSCPAARYVLVNAKLIYSTLLPYPWAPTPLSLTGQAYRRLQ